MKWKSLGQSTASGAGTGKTEASDMDEVATEEIGESGDIKSYPPRLQSLGLAIPKGHNRDVPEISR